MLRTLLLSAAISLLVPAPAIAQQTSNAPAPGAELRLASGTITGTLSYPSDHIPREIHICAEGVESGKIACTNEHITQTGKDTRTTYRLEVEPGPYYVYSILPESADFDPSSGVDYRAYYSEFVTCGSQASCPSHEPIVVEVQPGKTVERIDPNDWYAPN